MALPVPLQACLPLVLPTIAFASVRFNPDLPGSEERVEVSSASDTCIQKFGCQFPPSLRPWETETPDEDECPIVPSALFRSVVVGGKETAFNIFF